MTKLPHPQPMSSFDPSRAALLHERRHGQVMVWDPECAEEWRRKAVRHAESVHWKGYIFDG